MRFIAAAALILGSCEDAEKAAPAPPAATAEAPSAARAEPATNAISACLLQEGEKLHVRPIRAGGTEPFWTAQVKGRCVTYSHPEDQQGTRVWTRYTAGASHDSWTGALGGQPFILKIHPAPDCSDGMSDRRYPLTVELTVKGEQRKGCAAPL